MKTQTAKLPVLLVLALVNVKSAPPFQQGKEIPGAKQQVSNQVIPINAKFCNNTTPYKYLDKPGATSLVSFQSGDLSSSADFKQQQAAISDLRNFEDKGGAILDPKTLELTDQGGDASRLLVRSFSAGTCGEAEAAQAGSTPFRLLDSDYYIINIVEWQESGSSGKKTLKVGTNNWYLFNTRNRSLTRQNIFGGKFKPSVSSDLRIYGSKTVGFLAIHFAKEQQDVQTLKDLISLQISYSVNVSKTQAANIQDLMSLLGILTGVTATKGEGSKQVGLYGGAQLNNITSIPDNITFSLQVKPQAVQQSNSNSKLSVQDGSIRPVTFHTVSGEQNKQAASTNGGSTSAPTSASPTPAPDVGCEIALTSGGSNTCSLSQTYNDEGLYHWDVSIGVPVQPLKTTNYKTLNGIVTANSVSTVNAYGFFDYYPVATDIVNPPAFAWPHVIVGLPFSGKVLNSPFFGGGGVVSVFKIPKLGPLLSKALPIQFGFYGGVVYDKISQPATLKVGTPASADTLSQDLLGHRVWKGEFGLEFSLRDVASKLTGKSSGTSTKSATKTGS